MHIGLVMTSDDLFRLLFMKSSLFLLFTKMHQLF